VEPGVARPPPERHGHRDHDAAWASSSRLAGGLERDRDDRALRLVESSAC
jgi:hypothetical protein